MKLDLEALNRQSGREIPSKISIGTCVFLQLQFEADLPGAVQLTFIFVS